MNWKITKVFILGLLCFTLINSFDIINKVFAEDSDMIEYYPSSEESIVVNEGIDDEQLIAGYIEKTFAIESTTIHNQSSKNNRNKLTGLDAIIYDLLEEKIIAVAAGELESTIFSISIEELGLEKTEFTASDLGVDYIYNNGFNNEAIQNASKYVSYDMNSILSALLFDHPYEMYWFDKTVGVILRGPGFGARYTSTDGYILIITGEIEFSFAVSQDYVGNVEYTINTEIGQSINNAVNNAHRIVDFNASLGFDGYDLLREYKDEICYLVSYNNDAASDDNTPYGNPWQLVWVFDNDNSTNVVCEGYSKAFQYLCDLTSFKNVSCYTVTGTMVGGTGAGNHMWNIVTMADGNNYLVDVTNCDSGTVGADYELFIVGVDENDTTSNVDSGYTFRPNGNTISYIYDDKTRSVYNTDELTIARGEYVDPESGFNYEVLTSDGELIFIRSDNSYANNTFAEVTDILGNTYSGRVFKGFTSSNSSWPAWNSVMSEIRSVKAAPKQSIAPTSMTNWFNGAVSLTEFNANGFDTRNVTNMSGMFKGCTSLTNLDISSFITEKVVSMDSMLNNCTSLKSIDLSGFDLAKTTNINYMFSNCSSIETLDLSSFDTSNVANMNAVLSGMDELRTIVFGNSIDRKVFLSLPVARWTDGSRIIGNYINDTTYYPFDSTEFQGTWSKIPNAYAVLSDGDLIFFRSYYSYRNATTGSFVGIYDDDVYYGKIYYGFEEGQGALTASDVLWYDDMSSINKAYVDDGYVIKPRSINNWFGWNDNITEFTNKGFDTSELTSAYATFRSCRNLHSVDLSNFDASKITYMDDMFEGCLSLVELDLSSFRTTNLKKLSGMFESCLSLKKLNLCNFDLSNVTDMADIFRNCKDLDDVTLGEGFGNWGNSAYLPEGYWFNGQLLKTNTELYNSFNENPTEMAGNWRRIKPITDITLDRNSISLNKGETLELSVELLPDDASITDVEWSSNNVEVATVSQSGEVSAISAGDATITVATLDGTLLTSVCEVAVHDYYVDFIWQNDNSATLVITDLYDNSAIEQNATVTTSVIKQGTCTESGVAIITATAEYNGVVYNDSKETEIPALGHAWKFTEFTWDEEGDPTAHYICENDESHHGSVAAEGYAKILEGDEPTCDKAGQKTYNAYIGRSASLDGINYADSHTEIIPALGHDYEYAEMRWSEDNRSAQGYFVCKNDEEHTLLVDAEVTEGQEEGKEILIATVTYDGITYTDKKEKPEELPTARLLSRSVNFEGILSMNFYIQIPEGMEGSYVLMEYSKAGTEPKKVMLDSTIYQADRDRYRVTFDNIPAKEMMETVSISVYDSADRKLPFVQKSGEEYVAIENDKYSYRVYDYGKALAEHSDAKYAYLGKALLNYGQRTQEILGYKTDELMPNHDGYLTEETVTVNPAYTENFKKGDASFTSKSLNFEGATSIFLYFLEPVSASSADTEMLSNEKVVVNKQPDGRYRVEVLMIPAKKLHEMYKLNIVHNGTTYDFEVSALSYANGLLGVSNEKYINMGKALYLYNDAARNYFGN